MYLALPASRPVRLAAAGLGLLALAGCGADSTGPDGEVGDARIVTSTTGEDLDPEGYTLVANSEETRPIGINDTVEASDLPPGRFVFELDDVAPNCAVEGSNPRTLQVRGGELASITFEVGCESREGDLEVTASTSGEDPDPDGYTVSVDDADTRSVDPNGTVAFAGLSEGTHRVELGDVASNCAVEGENPRQVEVPGGGTGSTTFEVVCEARTGDLEATVSTTGEDLDPDGYSVVVDDTRSQAVGPNGAVIFGELESGPHEVELEGVASNCEVEGENLRQVEVPGGGRGSTTFAVVCEAREGDLEVRASTTGSFIDSDGYEVILDGDDSRSLDRNGSVTFRDVAAGPHDLRLEDISSFCSVDGANPREVDVPAGGTASTTFEVRCGFGDDDDDEHDD